MDRVPTPGFLGFPGGLAGKESAYNAGDLGSIPGLGKYPVHVPVLVPDTCLLRMDSFSLRPSL